MDRQRVHMRARYGIMLQIRLLMKRTPRLLEDKRE